MTPEQNTRRLARLKWRYHNEPAYRERVLEQQKAYRQKDSNRAASLARKRRWMQTADPEHIRRKRAEYHASAMQKPERRAAALRRANVGKLKAYGLTPQDFDQMVADQGGVCAICGKTDRGRRLSVDHDHVTGGVRGLLCGPCNTGLGTFRDDPLLLRRAARYLEAADEAMTDRLRAVIREATA